MTEKETLIQRIQDCATPVYIRYGFGWKGATWSETSKENLLTALDTGRYAHYDVCTINGGLGVNFYSANDML